MPALAGASRMHYPKFLAFNAAGGLVWGTGFVLLGFYAGNSYDAVAKLAGRDFAAAVVVLGVLGLAIWHVRRARRSRRDPADAADRNGPDAAAGPGGS